MTVTAYRVLKSCSQGHSYQVIQRHIREHSNLQRYTILKVNEGDIIIIIIIIIIMVWVLFPLLYWLLCQRMCVRSHLRTDANFVIGHCAVESSPELKRN